MPATKRRFESGVMQRLLDEPYRVEFFQAVRLIELWLRQNGIAHDKTLTDYIRFRNSVSLSFPPSQIEALQAHADTPIVNQADLLQALLDQRLQHISITPAFMGFLGGNGALPFHYSDAIAAYEQAEQDEGPRAFLDLLSNRALALFYQAWGKYRLEYKLDAHGKDGFLPLLLALAGVEPKAAPRAWPDDEGAVAPETLGFYAAQIRARAVSGRSVAGVLGEYFGVPITLEQFIGGWDIIPPEKLTRLGLSNNRLGGFVIGKRIWRRDLRVRIRIGPLDTDDYDRFLPGASHSRALKALLGTYAVNALIYEVQLVLHARHVRGMRLTSDPAQRGTRLGYDAFLITMPATRDRDDMIYELRL